MPFVTSFLSKRKLKTIKKLFITTFAFALKRKSHLSPTAKKELLFGFESLQNALLQEDVKRAKKEMEELKQLSFKYLKKSSFRRAVDFIIGVAIALVFALVIRQMWFELYEIPTGSMRPTLKEKDRLTVSKLNFGLNVPFFPAHFYFDPSLIKRSGIFIFTSENMPVADSDTKYFYFFPGKKLLVKRLMAKAGDTIYFYGGKIYGMNRAGEEITAELNLPFLEKIDHIPFMRFEGKTSVAATHAKSSSVTFSQMGQQVLKLSPGSQGKVESTLLIPEALRANPQLPLPQYGDLWGIKNFAMARLLSQSDLPSSLQIEKAPLYLELRHDPNTQNATFGFAENGKFLPQLNIETSYIPLTLEHLKTLFANLYTARFEVKNGLIRRYGSFTPFTLQNRFLPKIHNIPDGCYEFYYGKAYEVLWQGITKELPPSHPLYEFSLERLSLFFNLGIEFNTLFSPSSHSPYYPSRYAYFRDGSLYVMGALLLSQEEETLKNFVKNETLKASLAPVARPYFPFIDHKPPLLDSGLLDKEFISQFGLKIPDKSYLALGDNHAMSGDSRDFGFVPENNIKGGPTFIFWPFGNRFGPPLQPHYAVFVFPRLFVWGLAAVCIGVWIFYRKKKERLPLDLSQLNR